jgi:hypothetical protein
LFVDRAEPYLVPNDHSLGLMNYMKSQGAEWVEAELSAANDTADVVSALKAVLVFPDWCGSSWDSIEDCFEELREAWTFPLALLVHGVQGLIHERPHVALQAVLRLSALSHAFSIAGDQLVVAYAWRLPE